MDAAVKIEAAASDEDLIAGIAARNERAFGAFAERYTGLIFSVAFRMRRNRATAEDVVQETLLRVWQNAGVWQADKGASVRTWLCRIVVNLCIDGLRKSSRESLGPVPEEADQRPDAAEMVGQGETGEIMNRAMQALPERQRSALILFHYEEMAVAEIALVLQTSPKSVEGLLGRARQALKKELGRYQEDLR